MIAPNDSFLPLARSWLSTGLCVVPAKQNKQPALPLWKDLQKGLPVVDEVEEWFSETAKPHGIGIICGAVSGGLEVLDLDAKNDPTGILNENARAACDEFAPGLWKRLPIERTPSGGLHLYFRSSSPAGNLKLPQCVDSSGKLHVIAETRGEGGFIVAAPTPGYTMQQGDLADIPTISEDERDALLSAARSLDRSPAKDATTTLNRAPNAELTPLDDFNARGDPLALLQGAGWHICAKKKDGSRMLRRPGKDAGISASWNHGSRGKLCVFSSSTPFDTAPSTYSPAAIYAVLECGGDFKQAARELGRQGYGNQQHNPANVTSTPSPPTGGTRFPLFATEPDEKEILTEVEPIIEGLLEPGDKLSISSGAKSFKTWTLIQFGLCISAGIPWLGFRTRKRRVLFLNFEIKPNNFWKRVFRIRRALQLEKSADFTVWNLRGSGFSMDDHADELIRRAKEFGAGVIILDPIYKLFGKRNESSAGDMATLMALFDKVATETGAAIVYAHHYAKGAAASKDPNDRSSGSGVFARDPDCLVAITRLDEKEGANSFAVEVTLRDFAPVDTFGIRRAHPLMVRADNVNPANLFNPTAKKRKYSVVDLVKLLPAEGLTTTKWQKLAHERIGISSGTFYNPYLNDARGLAEEVDGVWHRKAS